MMPNFRNPFFNNIGTIDCEIEHPVFGWIPFTCSPDDTGANFDTTAFYQILLAANPSSHE